MAEEHVVGRKEVAILSLTATLKPANEPFFDGGGSWEI